MEDGGSSREGFPPDVSTTTVACDCMLIDGPPGFADVGLLGSSDVVEDGGGTGESASELAKYIPEL